MTTRDQTTVRRQARGRQRMESILDAAELIVAEVGYDEMTTNAVAARAGISPGSLYQFFANKAAILDGLRERYAADLGRFWEAQLTAEMAALPVAEVVDRIVDAIVAFKGRPAFWALFHGSVTSAPLADASRDLDTGLSCRLDALFAAKAPHLTPERRELVGRVAVATVKGLMPLVLERSRQGQGAEAAAELKDVLTGYLAPALAPP